MYVIEKNKNTNKNLKNDYQTSYDRIYFPSESITY